MVIATHTGVTLAPASNSAGRRRLEAAQRSGGTQQQQQKKEVDGAQDGTAAAGGTIAQGGGEQLQGRRGLWGSFAFLPGWGVEIRAGVGGVTSGLSWVQLLGVGLPVLQVVLLWRVVGLLVAMASLGS
jgi:hypothetical protein